MNDIRYLNNDGSRWVTRDMKFVLVLPDGTRKERKADYYFSFGNFAGIAYRIKGVRFVGLPKSPSGSDTWLDSELGQPSHVFHKE